MDKRSKIKEELKNETKEYNNRQKKKIQLSKEEVASNIQLTSKQEELFKTIKNNTLTIIQGPSGTAKTFTACYTALMLYATKKISKIIITKPLQESGESVGFLPGNLDLKVEPFMRSYMINFEKIIGKSNVDMLVSVGDISIQPLAYMRGMTFSDCIILLDEAQNCTMKQIMLWITRLGGGIDEMNAKAVLMGDISQYDISKRDSKMLDFIDMVKDIEGVSSFKFEKEDIVRNKMLQDIVERYEIYKSQNDIK